MLLTPWIWTVNNIINFQQWFYSFHIIDSSKNRNLKLREAWTVYELENLGSGSISASPGILGTSSKPSRLYGSYLKNKKIVLDYLQGIFNLWNSINLKCLAAMFGNKKLGGKGHLIINMKVLIVNNSV